MVAIEREMEPSENDTRIDFISIMLGFLFQWPTLITLIMFPILMTMYIKLAYREEREVLEEFGEEYRRYAAATSACFPRLGSMLQRTRV